jgi:MscS family membrane protein
MIKIITDKLLGKLIQAPLPIYSFLVMIMFWLVVSVLLYVLLLIVLRKIFRKIPGEIDDIVLTILAKPIVISTILHGINSSIVVFDLSPILLYRITHSINTVLIVIGTYVSYRIIKEVIIRYGQTWANNTDSRIDDIVVPIVNLFGTIFLFLSSLLFTLSYWGVNITSLLVSAGLAGVIIGLALQDNLTNMFSGINLIMDAPFKINDLIVLDNGKICKVEKFGLRATQLYNIEDQTAVFIPNRDLSNSVITNITKPTVDLKVCIDVGIGYKTDLKQAKQILEEIAFRHPNVLVSQPQISNKISVMKKNSQLQNDFRYQQAIQKLQAELTLNEGIIVFEKKISKLIQEICFRQKDGIEGYEKDAIKKELPSIDKDLLKINHLIDGWLDINDPWIDDKEIMIQTSLFEKLKAKLDDKWGMIKKELLAITYDNEAILHLLVKDFKQWLYTDFKQVHDLYKDPSVSFKNFGASSINISLEIYIDNIILEHFERKQRVVREVAFEMIEEFRKAKIEIPNPQMDVWLKK